MTNLITATVNGADISSRIQKASITRKATEGIGNFTLLLNNNDGSLTSSQFPVNAVNNISLAPDFGGTQYPFFNGYLDIPDFIQTQDQKSKSVQVVQLQGRDFGQDLQNKTVWGSDSNHINSIIYNLLTFGQSPPVLGASTNYTEIVGQVLVPDTTTSVFWDSQGRTLISDNIRRLLNLANFDGYVDLNKNWVMFPVGTISSGINLYDVPDGPTFPNSPTTNQQFILKQQSGSYIPGFYTYNGSAWSFINNTAQNNIIGPVHVQPVNSRELRNVISAYGGIDVNDSWTDWGTAQYWFAATNAASIIDYVSTDIWQLPQAGASVLKITAKTTLDDTNQSIMWGMNFPGLFHWYLPFNQVSLATIKFSIFVHNAAGTPENQDQTWTLSDPKFITPSISLTDNLGNIIHFQWGGNYRFNKWLVFECNVGYNLTSEAQIYDWSGSHGPAPPFGDQGHDKWVLDHFSTASGNTGFNWKIVNVTFLSGGESGALPSGPGIHVTRIDYILFDNLVYPQVQVVATADHSGLNNYNAVSTDGIHSGLGVCPICLRYFSQSPYGQRQLTVTRTNINYQTDLNNYAETVCNQRMTPLSTVSLRCDGRAGLVAGAWNWYPGKNISLNGSESYRMIEITHTIERNVEGSGFSHVVDLSLVPKFMQLDMEQWTYSAHGDVGVARQLHDRVQALENTYQLFNPTS